MVSSEQSAISRPACTQASVAAPTSNGRWESAGKQRTSGGPLPPFRPSAISNLQSPSSISYSLLRLALAKKRLAGVLRGLQGWQRKETRRQEGKEEVASHKSRA